MSDDARRVLTEEDRARIFEARKGGGLCGLCGWHLAEGETVWVERIVVHGDHGDMARWQVPLGVECASPDFRAAMEGIEPERCAGCGRGVYYATAYPLRRAVTCSRRCVHRVANARFKEARGS